MARGSQVAGGGDGKGGTVKDPRIYVPSSWPFPRVDAQRGQCFERSKSGHAVEVRTHDTALLRPSSCPPEYPHLPTRSHR